MLKYIKWLLRGRPMIKFEGTHCGCCGAWIEKKFEVRDYKVHLFIGWDMCNVCNGTKSM